MALGKAEKEIVRAAIKRLKDEVAVTPEVSAALNSEALRLYLETWVIAPLELLSRDDRTTENLELAKRLAN